MLPCMEPIKGKNYDVLTFLPDTKGDVQIEASEFSEKEEPIGQSSMGFKWKILLFKDGGDSISHVDNFEAILGCPLEYASFLIPAGWFGMIVKNTANSAPIFDDMLSRVKEIA